MSETARSKTCGLCSEKLEADDNDFKGVLRCHPCNWVYVLYPHEVAVFDDTCSTKSEYRKSVRIKTKDAS